MYSKLLSLSEIPEHTSQRTSEFSGDILDMHSKQPISPCSWPSCDDLCLTQNEDQYLDHRMACCFLFLTPQVANGISPLPSPKSFRADTKLYDSSYSCFVDPLPLIFWPVSQPVSMLTSLLINLFQTGKGKFGLFLLFLFDYKWKIRSLENICKRFLCITEMYRINS